MCLRCRLSLVLLLALIYAPSIARADAKSDCFSQDYKRQISGCSELIETPGLTEFLRSRAYFTRARAHSLRGRDDLAIKDYDEALRLKPRFAMALNNRAWSLFKTGQARRGLPDVERSLRLNPLIAQGYDTRAHIMQGTGHPNEAYTDYKMAMRLGGKRMTKLYQCALLDQGLYKGKLDGIETQLLRDAIKACVTTAKCDPLPDNQECNEATS